MRIALDEVSPWTMRVIAYTIGALTLLLLLKAQGRSLAIPGGRNWLHVVAASVIFVVCFGLAAAFAQLLANTSRVIVINYSMPVWASLMAYLVLRERIDIRAAIGLALCIAGLGILVFPAAAPST
jgi:drug/metabolite transporter (DMT)-like permease